MPQWAQARVVGASPRSSRGFAARLPEPSERRNSRTATTNNATRSQMRVTSARSRDRSWRSRSAPPSYSRCTASDRLALQPRGLQPRGAGVGSASARSSGLPYRASGVQTRRACTDASKPRVGERSTRDLRASSAARVHHGLSARTHARGRDPDQPHGHQEPHEFTGHSRRRQTKGRLFEHGGRTHAGFASVQTPQRRTRVGSARSESPTRRCVLRSQLSPGPSEDHAQRGTGSGRCATMSLPPRVPP